MTEKIKITLTMEVDLKAKIDAIAKEQRRDFSAQLAVLAELGIAKLEADAKPATRGAHV